MGQGNKAEPRPIETGPLVEGLRVVRSGLKANDRVLIAGITNLQPGAVATPKLTRIRPRADAVAPTSQVDTAPPSSEATAR